MIGLGLGEMVHVKAAPVPVRPAALSAVSGRGGWYPITREPFAGAWQRNIEWRTEDVLSFPSVYACITLITSDIAKMPLQLLEQTAPGVWEPTENPAYSPVLRKPNHYQTSVLFYQSWMFSKLIHGNTYVLKERDNRGIVVRLYVLDPTRVQPMIASDGSIWYALGDDDLSGAVAGVTVPASEIIHDLMGPLYHQLCGTPPLGACGLAAAQGLRIVNNSTNFFGNSSQPGGLLSTDKFLEAEEVSAMQRNWIEQFSGQNAGKVAVLGHGLTYTPLSMTATDAQLVEQLKWSAEAVCTAFHVPPYMVAVGPAPAYNNVEALQLQYYSQCLQIHIESIEWLIDEGLRLPADLTVAFDLDTLLRMDTSTRTKAATEAISGGLMSPNEARLRYFGMGAVPGGESPYLQQQQFSLAALAERDAEKPFATPARAVSARPAFAALPAPAEDAEDLEAAAVAELLTKAAAVGVRAA
jgi:HK97 family phage portal protein